MYTVQWILHECTVIYFHNLYTNMETYMLKYKLAHHVLHWASKDLVQWQNYHMKALKSVRVFSV